MATAGQACKECRRRKSKCDRLMPICTSCQKFSRACLYERNAKTPLTRQHLTEVEAELARTKAMLEGTIPRQENGSGQDDTPMPLPADAISRDFEPSASGSQPVFSPVQQQFQSQQHRPRSSLAQNEDPAFTTVRPATANGPMVSPQSTRSKSSNMFSLESPPTSGDFEWDERSGRPNGDRFVDGMATLTGDSNDGGYLGVASGAALLRLTRGSDQSPETHTRTRARSIPYSLASQSSLDGFIDAYFSLFHRSYPILHEATFRAQFMEIIPRPSGNAWQVLLYAVAATGAFTTATLQTDVDLGLFEAARARFSTDMLETGSLVLVQALILMSNYAQKRDKPNSSYNYTGLARRIAMGIGLHKEFPNWNASLLTLEMRRRVWWCIYVFDVGGIITFSRPLDFPDSGVEVELPLNCHDSDITAGTRDKPLPANETTLYTHIRAQCLFHLATCQIYSLIISTPYPSAKELIELDNVHIGGWHSSLPPFFKEHAYQPAKYRLAHSILRWRDRNFRILMYRPFLVRRVLLKPRPDDEGSASGDNPDVEIAIQRCLEAARETVNLISTFWFENEQTMMTYWYCLYFLFQAVLIPIICLRNDPQSHSADSWRDQIVETIRVLESMVLLNPTAERCLDVVRSLCSSYLTVEENLYGPTDESPQTQLTNLYPMMWPTLEAAQFEGVDAMLQESTIMEFMNQIPGFN